MLGPLAVLALLGPQDSDQKASRARGPARLGPHPVVQEEARRLLARAAAAPAVTPYRGVQFVSAWTSGGATSEVVDVDHVPGKGTTVRSDGTVMAPARQMTLRGRRGAVDRGRWRGRVLLAAHYSLSVVGRDTWPGAPSTSWRPGGPGPRPARHEAARFWLDQETGLVLRREVYDGRGRVTRANAFVDVSVGSRGERLARHRQQGLGDHDRPGRADRDAGTAGHCPKVLPGPLRWSTPAAGTATGGGIMHLSYSDGIATVSVFEQRGRLDADGLAGHHARGRRRARGLGQRRGAAAGGLVVRGGGLHRRGGRAGAYGGPGGRGPAAPTGRRRDTLGRLGRGLDRVASWFNPFG